MFRKLFGRVKKNIDLAPVSQIIKTPKLHYENFDFNFNVSSESVRENALKKIFQKPLPVAKGMTLDSSVGKQNFMTANVIPDQVLSWYASQSFIGYQMCAMLAQHWLISKACLMPAEDAVRNGYKITVNDGSDIGLEILDEMRELDVFYKVNRNLIEFIQMGRIFGIRVVKFEVDSDDPDYYKKPFNPDGVRPGSYRGISQIDPYWVVPQLDGVSAGQPGAINFYEPTWWIVDGQEIHRTHLIIYRTEEMPDVLKPTYLYGGVSIPQKIYSRVYAAERTADEAPMLALAKRLTVLKVPLDEAIANQGAFQNRMNFWTWMQNNFGAKVIDLEDEVQQFDTALADLDEVIMTQFQLVSTACNVPAVKLLGTTPKGFNSTGEYEEASYHETLKSMQTKDLTPFLSRHHLLVMLSDIAPKFNIAPVKIVAVWNALDEMTAKEKGEINKMNAETGATLIASGAIDPMDERQRIINDPESGYSGVDDEMPEQEELDDDSGA